MNNRGFSMLETVVAAAVIIVALTAVLAITGGTGRADRQMTGQEEYYNLQARMMMVLKNDLRSAFSIKKTEDGGYQLECMNSNAEINNLKTYQVSYVKAGAKKQKIERHINGKIDKNWDFSTFAAGREFKFEISVTE